ncbi:MAG: succinate dehydrogenase assembly factor 2 [Rhizobiaceae bacterium]
MDARRKQLLYRANHRGIKEMDILLGGFAAANLADLSDADVDAFEAISTHLDRDLLSWFTGEIETPADVAGEMFDRILAFQVENAK